MEVLIFLSLFALAMVLSHYTGIATDYLMDKANPLPRFSDNPPTYLAGKICGFFFGIYGFFLTAIFGGEYGMLWGVLVAAIAFPIFAFTIGTYVRVREYLEDLNRGNRRLFCW